MNHKKYYKKIFGILQKDESLFFTPLFDEVEIQKVSKKKIHILFKGPYSKGIPNNQENALFQAIEKFFDTHHKTFGIQITITKNIPQGTGLKEEKQIIDFVLSFLHAQYAERFTSQFINILSPKDITIYLFPEYNITQQWLYEVTTFLSLPENKKTKEHLFHYSPQFSLEENIIFSYYPDIFTKYNTLQQQYKNDKNKEIGLIGQGSALYILER